jgi:hypothetical protein
MLADSGAPWPCSRRTADEEVSHRNALGQTRFVAKVLSNVAARVPADPHTGELCIQEGVECCMAKEQEAVDNLLDALVWMRRKSKKREPVDALIDELVKMRRKAKKKVAKKNPGKKKTRKRAKR